MTSIELKIALGAVLFALISLLLCTLPSAEAQQPTKVPRIGYLRCPLALNRPVSRHSGRVCASLVTWRGKTLSLSIDMQRENSIASPRLRPS